MKVTITRFNPDTGSSWEQEYEINCIQKSMSVEDVLEYIAENLDHTLGFYRHSICNHGICGRCMISVNGKAKLACTELATDYNELHIAPAPKRQVIRDLVTKQI